MIPNHANILSMIFSLLLATVFLFACSAGLGAPEPPPTAMLAPTNTPQPTSMQASAEITTIEDVLYASAVEPTAKYRLPDIYHLPGSDEQKPVVIWAGFSAGAWIGSIISFAEGDLQGKWDAYAAANDGPAQRVECSAIAELAHVKGFVGNSGSYHGDFWLGDPVIDDWTNAFLPLQMIANIGNNPDLKVRIIHGRSDPLSETPFEAAERFATALKESDYDVKFLPQDGYHQVFKDAVIEQIQALGE